MFWDDFSTSSKIHANSSNWYRNTQYQQVTNTRSQFDDYLREDFESSTLTGWIKSAGVTRAASNYGDNQLGYTAQIDSGSTVGSYRNLYKTGITMPGTQCGIHTHFDFPCTDYGSAADTLCMTFNHTSGGKMTQILASDTYLLLANVVGGSVTYTSLYNPATLSDYYELWIEWADIGGGLHKVDLYLGATLYGTWNVELPAQTSGDAGKIHIQQNDGANANRIARIALVYVGPTQLCDAMDLQTINYATPCQAKAFYSYALVEDVSGTLDVANDVISEISINNRVNYYSATVTNMGVVGLGKTDWTKNVYLLRSQYIPPPTGGNPTIIAAGVQISAKWKFNNHKLVAISGIGLDVRSHY